MAGAARARGRVGTIGETCALRTGSARAERARTRARSTPGEAARGAARQCGGGEVSAGSAAPRAHDPYAEEDDDEVVGGEWAATMGVY